MKKINPNARVIGVSLEVASAMHASLQAGRPVEIEEKHSLADALLGGIGLDNKFTFRIVQELVDEVVLISEEEVAEAMFFALNQHRLAIEGAAAVGLSAIINGKADNLGNHTVVIISGGNVDPALLTGIAAKHYQNRRGLDSGKI